MSDIPLDVYREILLRLPAVSLFRFRAVSKRWRELIDDSCFVKAHINNNQFSSNCNTIIFRNLTGPPFCPLYYFDLAALNLTNGPQTIPATPLNPTPSELSRLPCLPVAACNGLILITPQFRNRIIPESRGEREIYCDPEGTWEIRNPLTHERLMLPQLRFNSQLVGFGLGYDYAADDYKVVWIDYDVHDKSLSQTHVYSLKSDSWRTIGNCPFNYWGALHWVSNDEIIVFDVGTENYRQLELPLSQTRMRKKSLQLDALGGCLFLSYYIDECPLGGSMNSDYAWVHFDVWVMSDYGSQDSWIKLFELRGVDVFYTYGILRPVAYMKNKNGVLLQRNIGGLFWFDVWSNSLKEVTIHGICKVLGNYSAQIFVGSLFRLHDSCGRVAASKGRMRKKEMTMQMDDTKLTFCVKEFVKNDHSPQHDRCYSSLYRYNSQGEVRAASFVSDAHTNKQLSSNTSNIIIRNSTGPPFHPLYSFDFDDLKFANGLQEIAVTPLEFTPSLLSLLPAFPVSACNGLILVAGKSLEIWNPLTHERLKLLRGKCNPNPKGEAFGLGYDYTTDDYKVVVIHDHRLHRRRHGRDNFACQTHVYSLSSDSWRNAENCPWRGPRGPGVFLSGALHWTMFNAPYGTDTIIVFDLATENYRQLQAPPLRERDTPNTDRISGELEHYDVWVLKDYADKDSWIKFFSLDDEECRSYRIINPRPVAFMKDKTQILLQDDGLSLGCSQDDCSGFFMFDVESNSMKRVGIHGLTGTLYAQYIPRTIFRLHDNCGVNGRATKRRRRLGKRTINMKMTDTT
ncbi:hypothetical protein CASFOL_020259 [Castilleja foliolosa]|uniref:F-box domain-containing protein n=1 Tax=Castilleja foliolosa TaxID=1961234 RepID=A0ABD3D157_9LAMI